MLYRLSISRNHIRHSRPAVNFVRAPNCADTIFSNIMVLRGIILSLGSLAVLAETKNRESTDMPDRFSINFTEFFQFPHDGAAPPTNSSGHWHYDYAKNGWMYQHDTAMMSMFCQLNADQASRMSMFCQLNADQASILDDFSAVSPIFSQLPPFLRRSSRHATVRAFVRRHQVKLMHSPFTRKFCPFGFFLHNTHCSLQPMILGSMQPCQEHFLDNELYVKYANGTCCHLCGADDCCSILKSDWLTADLAGGDTYQPAVLERIAVPSPKGGPARVCQGYGRPGATTKLDAMYFWKNEEGENVPCRYFEDFTMPKGMKHNMTFSLESFSTHPITDWDRVFQVPDQCKRTMCPTPFTLPPGYDKSMCPGHRRGGAGAADVVGTTVGAGSKQEEVMYI